ncbi:MAG: IS66 family transposase, partial [Armatimonadota bacterium]|nr:IS66 family transposase [Armatimonadota bacterium]
TGPPKDHTNSSVPPSKSRKPNRGGRSNAKRGPKKGHQGHSRRRQEPDITLQCRPTHCDDCGADLSHLPGREIGSSQVVEIPPVRPVVIEARRYEVDCPHCGHHQQAQYPPALEPERTFGPRIEALVAYLQHVQHISYERLQQLVAQVFGLDISQGAIANIVRRVAESLQPRAGQIQEAIRASPVIGCDETGARVDGNNRWQWVFETPRASYHLIADSRGSRVIDDVLGDAKPQVWVSDCFSAQMKAPAQRRQLCMAHQLRDLEYGIEAERCSFCWRMQQLFRRAMRLDTCRDELPEDLFAAQVRRIEAACDALLDDEVSGENGRRLQKRYRKHRESLFTFLHRADVPPDNNASERALRKPVVHRKVSGGFRSRWGAEAYATVATVLQTARKHGRDALETLTDALGPCIDDNLLLQPP